MQHAGTRTALHASDPQGFVPAAWRSFVIGPDGRIDRRIWEIALAQAVRDALRAGNLFLTQSRQHVSFWNLLHSSGAGRRLGLQPTTSSACLKTLTGS